MKIKVYCVGKTAHNALQNWLPEYIKRLSHYVRFEWTELPELKNTKNLRSSAQNEAEGDRLLNVLEPSDVVVLFDEKGECYGTYR